MARLKRFGKGVKVADLNSRVRVFRIPGFRCGGGVERNAAIVSKSVNSKDQVIRVSLCL